MAYMYSSMCTSSTRTPVQRTARTDDAHRRIRVHEQQGAAALVGFPGRIIHVQHSRFGPARPDQQPGHSPSPLGYARSTVQGASTESNQAQKKKYRPGPDGKMPGSGRKKSQGLRANIFQSGRLVITLLAGVGLMPLASTVLY